MSSSDKIIIKDLLLRGIIGLNDWEREKKQDILINLTLFTDMRAAGQSDNPDDILNYRTITKRSLTTWKTRSTFLSKPWQPRSRGSASSAGPDG